METSEITEIHNSIQYITKILSFFDTKCGIVTYYMFNSQAESKLALNLKIIPVIANDFGFINLISIHAFSFILIQNSFPVMIVSLFSVIKGIVNWKKKFLE